ncbi:hypothetical protein ACH4TE_27495 [Streptomyces sioyaensis]|uniref:hypothetical protein n=1 Tax=Streptomyces sioyaensis TaxID=67364 RepID=UPI00379D6837
MLQHLSPTQAFWAAVFPGRGVSGGFMLGQAPPAVTPVRVERGGQPVEGTADAAVKAMRSVRA